jgi:hypothetical protein
VRAHTRTHTHTRMLAVAHALNVCLSAPSGFTRAHPQGWFVTLGNDKSKRDSMVHVWPSSQSSSQPREPKFSIRERDRCASLFISPLGYAWSMCPLAPIATHSPALCSALNCSCTLSDILFPLSDTHSHPLVSAMCTSRSVSRSIISVSIASHAHSDSFVSRSLTTCIAVSHTHAHCRQGRGRPLTTCIAFSRTRAHCRQGRGRPLTTCFAVSHTHAHCRQGRGRPLTTCIAFSRTRAHGRQGRGRVECGSVGRWRASRHWIDIGRCARLPPHLPRTSTMIRSCVRCLHASPEFGELHDSSPHTTSANALTAVVCCCVFYLKSKRTRTRAVTADHIGMMSRPLRTCSDCMCTQARAYP